MKKFFLYAAAAVLSLSFAACSSDDDLSSGGGKTITADQVSSYAKLAIAMPQAVGSRAFTNDGFVYGDTKENAITDIKLVLYSEDGLVVGTGVPVSNYKQDDPTGDDNTNIALEEDVVFHLTLEEGAPEPAKVVAFVNLFNGEDEVPAPYDKATLDELSAGGELTLDKFVDPANGFAMTNSGYYKGNDYVFAADLDANNMFSNQAAATGAEKAATIYVERVAAKVQIVKAEDLDSKSTVTGFTITDIAGKTVTLKYNVDKLQWGATGLAQSAYTIKKQFDTAKGYLATNWEKFNQPGYFRSYWAEGVNYTTPYNGGYLDAETNEVGDDNPLKYITIEEAIYSFNDYTYVAEQTYDYAEAAKGNLFNPVIPSTSVILIADYKVTGSDYDFSEGFYLLYTGPKTFTIYTKSQLAGYLLNRNGISEVCKATNQGATVYKTTEENAGIDYTEFVTVKADEDGKYVITEVTGLYNNDDTHTAITADDLTKTTNARYYSESKSYFYVPIEHNGKYDDEVEAEGTYGVVRNHSYVLSINSITGLGAPMDADETGEGGTDPKPIVPDPDDLTDAYINASLKVLEWHGVTQDVEL